MNSSGASRRRFLTKEVHPEWYRRYAKILDYEERIYLQPLRELKEEKAMRIALESSTQDVDQIALARSKKIAERKGKKVQLVLQILEGNVQVDVNSLRLSSADGDFQVPKEPKERRQTLFWRKRAIRPSGYALGHNSKWRLFWENNTFKERLDDLITRDKSSKIKNKWRQALRTTQGVNNFTAVLADIAGMNEDKFKKTHVVTTSGNCFDKNHFKAISAGKTLDQEVIFTLSKTHDCRTGEEAYLAARALQVIYTFGEFPVKLQRKICEVAWYLEVAEDKHLLREGHMAESFYFLLSGKVVSYKMSRQGECSQQCKQHDVGSMIGEEVITCPGYRQYSTRATEKCQVIMVEVEDYDRVCLNGEAEGLPPDHTVFLSQLSFMKYFPVDELVSNSLGHIQIFYFRNGAIVSNDIFNSKTIAVVFQGSCKVLAEVVMKHKPTKTVRVDDKIESRAQTDNIHKFIEYHPPEKQPSSRRFRRQDFKQRLRLCIQLKKLPLIGAHKPGIKDSIHRKISSEVSQESPTETPVARSSGGSRRDILAQKRPSQPVCTRDGIASPRNSGNKRDTSERSVSTNTGSTCGSAPEHLEKQAGQSMSNQRLGRAASLEVVILSKQTDTKSVKTDWIHFKSLVEGDQVGIEYLDLGDGVDENPPRIVVVSEGATVILMQKDFFMDSANDHAKMDLRANGPRFPRVSMLKKELSRKTGWSRFQQSFLSGYCKKDPYTNKLIRNFEYPQGIYSESV